MLSTTPLIPSLAFTPAWAPAGPLCRLESPVSWLRGSSNNMTSTCCFQDPWKGLWLCRPGIILGGQSEGVIEESQGRELGTAHLRGRHTGPRQELVHVPGPSQLGTSGQPEPRKGREWKQSEGKVGRKLLGVGREGSVSQGGAPAWRKTRGLQRSCVSRSFQWSALRL